MLIYVHMLYLLYLTFSFAAVLTILDFILDYKESRSGKLSELLPGLAVIIFVYGVIQYLLFYHFPSIEILAIDIQEFLPGYDLQHLPLGWLSITLVFITLVATFYFSGLVDYVIHRWFSHSRWFWFTHEYHHIPSIVSNWMPGIVARPFSIISVAPQILLTLSFYSALFYLFKLPMVLYNSIYIIFALHIAILVWIHSSTLRRHWWIHRILKPLGVTTPQEHIFHHTTNNNRNYANLTTCWDKVFGTYVDPVKTDHTLAEVGLSYNQDFLGAITANQFHIPEKYHKFFSIGTLCGWKKNDK